MLAIEWRNQIIQTLVVGMSNGTATLESLANPQTLLNVKLSSCDIAVPPFGVYPKEVEHVLCSYMDIHDRIIHNSQKVKTAHMS